MAITPDFKYGLGVAYARAGMRNEALAIATETEKENNAWFTIGLADVYAALGDQDKAIYWLQMAYEQHHDFFPWSESNPYYKALYNDQRFQKIMAALNLPEMYPYSQLVSIE
jgi:hypothetical protein